MESLVLLIASEDVKGLVAGVSSILFRHDCNIIENGEFVDRAKGRFFMRTAFEGDIDREKLYAEILAALPAGAHARLMTRRKKRIAILATKEAHCLGDLLVRCDFDDLNAEIATVIANHDFLRDLTEKFNKPFHHVGAEGLSREQHEQAVLNALEEYRFDYVVMAKYMRILTPGFIQAFPQRIINIHHSFLPAFIGANPYRQAYERGVKTIGATAHFASVDLDEGPIIAQGTIPVDHSHSARDMARFGRDVEKTVLARALDLVFDDRVFVHGNRTIVL
ncbi:MAG: formyltetrahydrofolate deformylase [Kiritimatiellia bacterium]|jgi:formyltetrahydrofolate deformylase